MFIIPMMNASSRIISHSTHYSNINGNKKINTTDILKDYKNGKLETIIEKKTNKDKQNKKFLEIVGKKKENGHYLVKLSDKKNTKSYLIPRAILVFIQGYFNQMNFKQLQNLLKVFHLPEKKKKKSKKKKNPASRKKNPTSAQKKKSKKKK
jgi:hypothetical protein